MFVINTVVIFYFMTKLLLQLSNIPLVIFYFITKFLLQVCNKSSVIFIFITAVNITNQFLIVLQNVHLYTMHSAKPPVKT